ncbi:MAG: hypothetical protein R3233_01840 [Xanthomonadales bacterium]|nr:hypothetical protein [Xanthomonadales bacterium]
MIASLTSAFQDRAAQLDAKLRAGPVGRFLSWWWGELRGLLPAEWRARLAHARRRVLLRLGRDELELGVLSGEQAGVLDVFPLDQDPRVLQQRIRDLLLERELAEVPRDLLLDDNDVLRREIIMPLAAEANLRQAIAFDMDRQTPFAAEDVYFDYRVIDRDREAGQLRAEAVVAPRPAVDVALEQLQRVGLPPSGVDIRRDGLPQGFNLLPAEQRHRAINQRARFNTLLAVATVVMLALLMAQTLAFRRHQIERVEQQIEEVRAEAQRVRRIQDQIEDASESAGFLQARRAEQTPVVVVLAAVTEVLPDDTYLDRLMISGGEVQMQGKSANAQRLIELVNQSPRLDSASFSGPTRLDARSGREIFDLSASIEAAADAAAAAGDD